MSKDYIDSYYSRTLADDRRWPRLDGHHDTEICVIGGGMAGLATALGLAERGRKVVLLESRRIGWGASGRNGGFVSTGYAAGGRALVERVGGAQARALNDLTRAALALIRARIERYAIACGPLVPGKLRASWFDDPDGCHREVEFLSEAFGEPREFWPRDRVRELYRSERYYDGIFNPDGFSLHPLNFTRGIAIAATSKGAAIFEESAVDRLELTSMPRRVHTRGGFVSCDQLVFACSGHIAGLEPRLDRATLPVATYVLVTEPLEQEQMEAAIRAPYGVSDNRFAQDYYRPLADGRILWGGRVSSLPHRGRLKQLLLGDLLAVFPQLAGIETEQAWSGIMGYATHKMPQIGELAPGIWYCQGFGGHGMCATTAGGEAVARAIAEGDEEYRLFEPFGLTYAGGRLGPAIAQGVYWWWEFRDWLRARRPTG